MSVVSASGFRFRIGRLCIDVTVVCIICCIAMSQTAVMPAIEVAVLKRVHDKKKQKPKRIETLACDYSCNQ